MTRNPPSHRSKPRLLGSAWPRGTHENTNRLLRLHFPKAADLSVHCKAQLSAAAKHLNEHPEGRWETKLPQSVSMHVLRRSVETAGRSRHSRLAVPRSVNLHQPDLRPVLSIQPQIAPEAVELSS